MNTDPAVHLRTIAYGLAILSFNLPDALLILAASVYAVWLLWAWDVDGAAPSIESIPARPGHP